MRDIEKETEQRKEFCQLLKELAKSQTLLRDASERAKFYRRLENLYYNPDPNQRFRHYYSDIFEVLARLQVQRDQQQGSIEILGQNLQWIWKNYRAQNHDPNNNLIDISDSICKLYDHVSLDIARISYSDAADDRVSQRAQIRSIRSNVETLSQDIEDAKKHLTKMQEDFSDVQKEYVTILGIFASIVITFVAGVAFSTSVLQNIHQVGIYRLVLIILLIGLVMINVLWALFYFIDTLIHNNEVKGASHWSIRPFSEANTFILILIALTLIAWSCGAVERRNSYMESDSGIIEEYTPESGTNADYE